jgi:tRNA U34 5-carboxymethylaminomethyl modifying enzyme MnmG/GidA
MKKMLLKSEVEVEVSKAAQVDVAIVDDVEIAIVESLYNYRYFVDHEHAAEFWQCRHHHDVVIAIDPIYREIYRIKTEFRKQHSHRVPISLFQSHID